MKKLMAMLPMMALVIVCAMLLSASRKPVTIYLCGDGTMANHDTTVTHERGWGQVLPTFLTEDATLENHALIGSSTKSFIEEGHWEAIRQNLKRGDIVLFQFGHNDPQADSILHASILEYEENLTQLIKEAEKKKAKVVLCTPISRHSFSIHTGELVNTHGGYPEAVRRVAQAKEVTLLDLTALTMDWLAIDGDSATLSYFENAYLSEAGALHIAHLAAEDLSNREIKFIAPYLVSDATEVKYAAPCKQ